MRLADLYCGVGTFGITLAHSVGEVIAVEAYEGNTKFLKENICINSISNLKIYQAYTEDAIEKILKEGMDVVIADPPRKGLGKFICESIAKNNPSLLAYISCDLATLTSDLKILLNVYNIDTLHFYDFFPHTPHIETLAILRNTSQ